MTYKTLRVAMRLKCIECGRFIRRGDERRSEALGGYRCSSCYEHAVDEL